MLWTEKFSADNYAHSDTAVRKGFDNSIPISLHANINLLHLNIKYLHYLFPEQKRYISSAYRSEELNNYLGGSWRSAHMQGLAIDYQLCRFADLREECENIRNSDIKFDQLILYDTFIHISFDKRFRGQFICKQILVDRDEHQDLHGY